MDTNIEINLREQRLYLRNGSAVLRSYPVSTASNGAGEINGSECTPRGRHVIGEKIGDGQVLNTVFVGRRPTGEIYDSQLRDQHPGRDWILTRILWLSGCESGFNSGGDVDTRDRYIYIHGAPDDADFTARGSRGCVRMRSTDIVELFKHVMPGTPVLIRED